MRALLPLFLLLALIGCTRTGTATLTISRTGELSFTVENGATQYPITLTSGQLQLADINFIDESAPVPTQLLEAPALFDFVANDALVVGPVELPPKGFEQLHIFIESAVDGPLIGTTLQLTGQVTLTNGTTETFIVELGASRASQEMLAAISIKRNRDASLEASFDPTILLDKIDFDTLAADGNLTLSPDSADPLVVDSLATILDSLLRSFKFDGPTGGDNS